MHQVQVQDLVTGNKRDEVFEIRNLARFAKQVLRKNGVIDQYLRSQSLAIAAAFWKMAAAQRKGDFGESRIFSLRELIRIAQDAARGDGSFADRLNQALLDIFVLGWEDPNLRQKAMELLNLPRTLADSL